MGYKKRTYKIEEVMTGNPPAPAPRLLDDGKVVPPDKLLIFNKDTDQMKKVDHYRIRFDIKNFGSSRLRFLPDKDNVMWAQPGTACPQSACHMPGVFWVDDMDDDGEWIDVINMDMKKEQFWFTLNLIDKSVTHPTPDDYVQLDPGGGNEDRGGTGSGFSFSAWASLGLGFCAGLVAFIGARQFLPGW